MPVVSVPWGLSRRASQSSFFNDNVAVAMATLLFGALSSTTLAICIAMRVLGAFSGPIFAGWLFAAISKAAHILVCFKFAGTFPFRTLNLIALEHAAFV